MATLIPPKPTPNVVSLTVEKEKRFTDEEITNQTDRASYALEPIGSWTGDEINAAFWEGHDRRLREHAVAEASLAQRKQRIHFVQQYADALARDGRTITPEERKFIVDYSTEEFAANPNTVIERLYTKRLVQEILTDDAETYETVAAEEPEAIEQAQNALEDYGTMQEIAKTVLAEVSKKVEEASIWDKGIGFAKGLIPFYTWFQQRDRIKKGGSLLLGQNIEEQMQSLYFSTTPEEFEQKLRDAIEPLLQENVLEALQFASAAVSYSGSDALWDNVFTGLDALDVGTTGLAVASATLLRRARSAARAGAQPRATTKAGRQVLSGNIAGASQTKAHTRLQSALDQSIPHKTPMEQLRVLMTSGFGSLDPKAYMRDVGSLSNERAARLEESLSNNAEILLSTMTDIPSLTRISDEAAAKGFALAEKGFRTSYPNLEDAIVEVRNVRESDEVFGGVDRVDFLIGKKDATGFSSEKNALFHANKMYRLPEGSFKIVEEAGNFFIQMSKNIDESDIRLIDLRLGTNNQAPKTWATTFLGILRSNQHLVSKEHAAWRSVATFGGNAVLQRIAELGKNFERLGKNEFDRIRGMMEHERVLVGSKKPPIRTVAELEQAWSAKYGNMPTDNELRAWFTFRQLTDYDWHVRNISVYRDKARLGVEQFSVGYSRNVTEDDVNAKWQFVNSDFFEGRRIETLPSTQEPYTVAWIDPEKGRWNFTVSDRFVNPKQRQKLTEAIESGEYKIIQVMNPRDPVLRSMIKTGGEPVEYILVKGHKSKPISFEQVEYSADLPYHNPTGFFIRQTKSHKTTFGRRMIDGDVVVQRTVSNLEGNQLLEAYETARRMVRDALSSDSPDLSALSKFVKENLPFSSAREFIQLFKGTEFSGSDAVFDLDTPFVLAEAGKKSGDVRPYDSMFSEELIDLENSSHFLGNNMSSNMLSSSSWGSQQNPIVNVNAPQTLDPMVVLGRAGARIARSRFYNDYVHRSVEDWANEFADTFAVSPELVYRNPMKYLLDYSKYVNENADLAKVNAAKNGRRAILNLLSIDSEDNKYIKWTIQKLVDGLYKTGGQKRLQLLDPWMFNKKTDPVAGMRSVVFHPKLGMFNPIQFPLQGLASVYAGAIDGNPIRAIQGQFAYWAMRNRALMSNAESVERVFGGKVAKALGVDSKILDEMYELWQNTGVSVIRGEYSTLDDYLNPRLFFGRGPGKKALDASLVFFREGNAWHRGTAFATAFLRWRQMNPTRKLNNTAIKEILDRTDLMYINMTRAGNAAWQQGITSIPGQWFAFHARLTEELLGKRLTNGEKARILGVMSAIWGVPIGVGGQILGAVWPVNDSFQQYAQENGLDVDTNILTKVLSEGLADMTVEMLTGTDFNVNERLGPNGLSWLRDVVDGELFDVMSGASGSFLGELFNSASPFGMALTSVFDDKHGTYNLRPEDFIDVLKNVSVVNNSLKAYMVFNAGKWQTRNETTLLTQEKGNLVDALMAFSGLQPDEISETYLKIRSNRQHDAMRRQVEQLVMKEFERGLKAAQNGDHEVTMEFFRRAAVLMETADWTPLQRGEIFRRAMEINRDLVEEIGNDFMVKDPARRRERFLEERMEE